MNILQYRSKALKLQNPIFWHALRLFLLPSQFYLIKAKTKNYAQKNGKQNKHSFFNCTNHISPMIWYSILAKNIIRQAKQHIKKTPPMILLNDSVLFFIFSKVSFKCDKVIFKQNAVYLNFNFETNLFCHIVLANIHHT